MSSHLSGQEESDGRLVELEEKQKSEMKSLQTDIAAWTEVCRCDFFSDFYTSSISSWVKLGGFYSRSWVKSGRFRLQLIINESGYFRNLAS